MLRPINTEYTTTILNAPKNWNSVRGNCTVLPVCIEDGINYSWWKPKLIDRLKILIGFNIRLAVVGSQPPVSLEVENTKEVVLKSPDVPKDAP